MLSCYTAFWHSALTGRSLLPLMINLLLTKLNNLLSLFDRRVFFGSLIRSWLFLRCFEYTTYLDLIQRELLFLAVWLSFYRRNRNFLFSQCWECWLKNSIWSLWLNCELSWWCIYLIRFMNNIALAMFFNESFGKLKATSSRRN